MSEESNDEEFREAMEAYEEVAERYKDALSDLAKGVDKREDAETLQSMNHVFPEYVAFEAEKKKIHLCTKDEPHDPKIHGPYAVHIDMEYVGKYKQHGLCPNCGGRFPWEKW